MFVYSTRFRIKRRLWHIWKMVLPMPLAIWPAAAAATVCFVQLQFLLALYTDVAPFPVNLGILAGLTYLAYWLTDRPTVSGMPLDVWLQLQVQYQLEPKLMIGECKRLSEPTRFREVLTGWSPKRRRLARGGID